MIVMKNGEAVADKHIDAPWRDFIATRSLTPEQVRLSETYQPGGTRRPANQLAELEGTSAKTSGCDQCHRVGKPNTDGEPWYRKELSTRPSNTPHTVSQFGMRR